MSKPDPGGQAVKELSFLEFGLVVLCWEVTKLIVRKLFPICPKCASLQPRGGKT